MRIPTRVKLFLRNLLVLLCVTLPLLVLLFGLFNREEATDFLGEAVLLYVGFIGPMVIGGVLYLLVLSLLTSYLPRRGRLSAFALAPLLGVGWVVFGMAGFFAMRGFAVSFIASVIVYGMLVKPSSTTS
jgi:hypothetical protein